MLDALEIKNQSFIESENIGVADAAQMARADHWTPHVADGLDAFARVIHEAESAKWAQGIAEACGNPAFRQRLVANPAEAVQEFGIALPAGLELRLVENTETVRHLVLPPLAEGGLDDAELKVLAESLALATSRTRLPQCWADTWGTSEPLDPGMPQPRPASKPSR